MTADLQLPFIVGRIGRPFGVKGWVHVESFTEPIDNIRQYLPWLLGLTDDRHQDWVEVKDIESRVHNKGIVARLDSSTTRDDAETYANRYIAVPATVLPEIEADQYFWADIEGVTVHSDDGDVLGEVEQILESGAHPILQVVGTSKTLLIPFVSEYVSEVVPNQKIVVAWDPDWS